ncbi:MAG: hypothetical protein P8X74_12120 [Reinekea sp.]
MGAPTIFEKQIKIKLLHTASTEEVTDSVSCFVDQGGRMLDCFLSVFAAANSNSN